MYSLTYSTNDQFCKNYILNFTLRFKYPLLFYLMKNTGSFKSLNYHDTLFWKMAYKFQNLKQIISTAIISDN